MIAAIFNDQDHLETLYFLGDFLYLWGFFRDLLVSALSLDCYESNLGFLDFPCPIIPLNERSPLLIPLQPPF